MLQTTPDGRKFDPNDYKVVEFHNNTDFDFTSELGAMYDGRPLFVGKGEKKQYPYHIGYRLAENLAKAVMLKGAPVADEPNTPTGKVLWDDQKLAQLKNSYLTELYTEETPIPKSETDRLFEKIAELEKLVKQGNAAPADVMPSSESRPPLPGDDEKAAQPAKVTYRDKQEVIAELEKRNITHDKRKSKDELEKLLA